MTLGGGRGGGGQTLRSLSHKIHVGAAEETSRQYKGCTSGYRS